MSREMEKLSPAEQEELGKCLQGTVMTHSFPGALAGGFIAKVASARMKFSPRRTFVNMAVSSFVGGCLGRIAGIPNCIEQTMQHYPDGVLARTVASRRKGGRGNTLEFAPDTSDQSAAIDGDPLAMPPLSNEIQPFPNHKQTYDDLRRQNRDEFMNRKKRVQPADIPRSPPQPSPPDSALSTSGYSDPPSPYADYSSPIHSEPYEEIPKARGRKRVNIYGDEIED